MTFCVHGGRDSVDPDQGQAKTPGTSPGLDADMITQPTVAIVVDDNMDILKSVARLLAGPTSK